MGFWDSYKREERQRAEPGDFRLEVIAAEQTVSRAGNEMIVVTLRPNKLLINIKHFFVKNKLLNQNLTEFFDAFGLDSHDLNTRNVQT